MASPNTFERDVTPLHLSQVIAASSVGGVLVSLLMTPLDVVKVRLQMQQRPIRHGQCFLYCNGLMDHLCPCYNGSNGVPREPAWYKRPGHFNSSFDALLKITRNEGLVSLWSGLSPTLVMALPQTVIYYTLNEYIKEMVLPRVRSDWQDLVPPVVGGVSRVVALAVISPLELVRIKVQSQKLVYSEVMRLMALQIQHSGVRSLWMGMGPSMLRDVPFSMLFWLSYDSLKRRHMEKTGLVGDLDTTHALMYGSFSGMVAGVLTLPFDVVKTHRQIELGEATIFNRPVPSTWSSLSSMYTNQGIKSLFAGFTPRLVKVTPACAVMIGTFEYLKGFFRHYNEGIA